MRYELVHLGVRFTVAELDEPATRWRWLAHPTKFYGSINRVEGGLVIGTRADAEATARKAIEVLNAA